MDLKKKSLIEAAMKYRSVPIVIILLLILFGGYALFQMPRDEYPQFTIRQGIIVGVYPGASSKVVEQQLTKTVENYIFGFKEIKRAKTYSQSKEGMMYIFVELNDNVKDADRFWSKLQHGLNELQVPTGVLALISNNDFGDTAALLITLSSDTKSYKELEQVLKKLEDECRKIESVSKIKHYGLQKEQIWVRVKPEKLNEYNIKSLSLLMAYQSNSLSSSAGSLKDGEMNFPIHFPVNFHSEKDVADQIVYSDPNGNVVRLKDIATIERRYQEPDNFIRQNGGKTILLSLEMQPGNNIVNFGKEVDKALKTFQAGVPEDIKVTKISNLPDYVNRSISEFMWEFLMAIVSVILVTMLLLPFRVASVAAITVPISVLITIELLYVLGFELNTVTLAALIIVLGMIVDNSIVIIDNHVEKIDHGFSPWHAAISSVKDLIVPVISATLAIIAAFFPLSLLVPGSAGEFLFAFPYVIGIALIVSILVAVFLVPYMNFVFIKKGLKYRSKGIKSKSMLNRLQHFFDQSLEKAFTYPKKVLLIGLGLIVLAIVLFMQLDEEMFPDIERNQMAVEVYLPTGSSLESTDRVVDSLERILLADKRVNTVTSFVGTSSPRFNMIYAPNMPSANYGQLLLNTTSKEATSEITDEYGKKLMNAFPNAHVKFKILSLLATKAPVEIRISGDSIIDLRNAQHKVDSILKKVDKIAWIRSDWDQYEQNIMVEMDRDKANRAGFSKGMVATSMMLGLNGLPLTTIWEDDYPVGVYLYQDSEEPKSIKTLEDLYVTSSSSFKAQPLRSFARLTPEWTQGTIIRRNGIRTLSVLVDPDRYVMASNVLSKIKAQLKELTLPNVTISYGGEMEQQKEVFVPMGIALSVSILLIFLILLFQFRRLKLSLLIMATMILGLPGAAIGLFLMRYPFGVTSFVGIISLCGIVVRNGIILIDYARYLHEKRGVDVYTAALMAGKRRMRPIFLTSAAAAVGVIPMIISGSNLWGPLGTVICFGLMISMVLTLYILPILYCYAYQGESKKNRRIPAKVLAGLAIFIALAIPSESRAQTNSFSLDSCKQIALANNKKIMKSDYDVKAAREQHQYAFTNYFPKVSVSAAAMRSSDYLLKIKTPEMNLPVYDGNPANLSSATQFAYIPSLSINALDYINFANLTVAMPIYVGGRIRNGNALANLGEDVSKQQQSMVVTNVLIRTEELYWNLISLKEKKKTLLSYKAMVDTLYRDVNNYVTSGMAQRNDLLKVQLKQNELESNLIKIENGIVLTTRALCQQIGIDYDSTLSFNEKPSGAANFPAKVEDPQNAVGNRVEYQLLNQAVKAEELQKRMAIGEFMPQISVSGIGLYYDVMDNTDKAALALANVSIPLTDWWGGAHKIKQQQMKIDKAKIDLEETTELLALQVEQTGNELTESWYQLKLSEKSVEQASENLKITEDNYHSGVVGVSDLLEAQALLQNANDNLNDALCNYQIRKAKHLQSTGDYH
jgi:multidrug efflux pump subunit AcrB/outer membrane protein TolC